MNDHLRKIKQLFLTYRNGIVSESLRKAGMPYKIIFGLQLPQIRKIANEISSEIDNDRQRHELANSLWADKDVRESRILALAIFPPAFISVDDAYLMATSLLTREETDLFPFLLLRHTPFIPEVLSRIEVSDNSESYLREALSRYL